MFKLLVVAGLCALANAVPKYGYAGLAGTGYGLAGSYGLGSGALLGNYGLASGYGLAGSYGLGGGALLGNYGSGYGLAGSYGLGGGALLGGGLGLTAGPIQAAVQSRQSVQFYDVPSTGPAAPINIDIGANTIPVNMMFRSRSSALNVQQMHEGQAGSFQETASQDEPHILRHTVTKPVLQEVREVIAPFRRITQTVQPVQESIETLVARNAGGAPAGNAVATLAAGPALATTGALGGGALLAGGPAFATAGALGGGALLAGGPAYATGATLLGTGLAGAGFGRAGYGYSAGAYGLSGLSGGKLYSKY